MISDIETTLAGVFAAVSVRIEDVGVDRVRESGDAAFVEAHSQERLTDREGGGSEVHCTGRGDQVPGSGGSVPACSASRTPSELRPALLAAVSASIDSGVGRAVNSLM